jgi:hypothetical protein
VGFTALAIPNVPYDRFSISQWLVVAVSLLPLACLASGAMLRSRKRRSRRRRGLCAACGYDLRGNPSAKACPECGHGLAG